MARLTSFNVAELRRMVTDHVEDLTDDVLREAQRTCPRGRGEGAGRLRRSLEADVRSQGLRVVGTVGSDLEYAIYVHEGRGPVRGNPVLGPLPEPYPRFVRRVRSAAAQPWLLEALRRAQPYPVTRGG